MATVMVVGANGFIGSNIVCELRKEHKVIALFRKNIMRFQGATHFTYTFEDRDYIKRLCTLLKPNVIIYVAGIHDMVECMKKGPVAESVNSLGPVVFMTAADTVPHRFVYISSSYVFDGKKGSYTEGDTPIADTVLGKQKLAGENYVRGKSPVFTILRLSPVFGLGSYAHLNFVDKLRMDLSAGRRHELPENEHHSFLDIGTLMQAIDHIIKNESSNETYHLGGLTKLSTYEFGKDLADKLGLDKSLIIPTRGHFPDQAFLDFSLNASKFVKNSEIKPLVLEESLDLFKKLLVR